MKGYHSTPLTLTQALPTPKEFQKSVEFSFVLSQFKPWNKFLLDCVLENSDRTRSFNFVEDEANKAIQKFGVALWSTSKPTRGALTPASSQTKPTLSPELLCMSIS